MTCNDIDLRNTDVLHCLVMGKALSVCTFCMGTKGCNP